MRRDPTLLFACLSLIVVACGGGDEVHDLAFGVNGKVCWEKDSGVPP